MRFLSFFSGDVHPTFRNNIQVRPIHGGGVGESIKDLRVSENGGSHVRMCVNGCVFIYFSGVLPSANGVLIGHGRQVWN